METITDIRPFLDQQESLAIWYAAYEGPEESVTYANPLFCEMFDRTLDEILELQRYQFVNPPDTTAETIAQYKAEDRQAMEKGHFLQRNPIGDGRDIVVLKLRFDRGVLGMFKFVDAGTPGDMNTTDDLDADFRAVCDKLA